jgi:hypothetical protein
MRKETDSPGEIVAVPYFFAVAPMIANLITLPVREET